MMMNEQIAIAEVLQELDMIVHMVLHTNARQCI